MNILTMATSETIQPSSESIKENSRAIVDPGADNESFEEEFFNADNELEKTTALTTTIKNASSDSELFEVTELKAKKNKSNLYIIKSYSFIDKTNGKILQLRQNTSSSGVDGGGGVGALVQTANKNNKNKQKQIKQTQKIAIKQDIKTTKATTKSSTTHFNMNGKTKSKLIKSKSLNDEEKNGEAIHADDDSDADEAYENFNDLLRQSESNQQHQREKQQEQQHNQRPKSMPANVLAALVTKVNGNAIECSTKSGIKRESFLRQSLRSIRRSFGASKKNSANTKQKSKKLENATKMKTKSKKVISLSSRASNSSASSSTSSTSKYLKDLDAFFAVKGQTSSTSDSTGRSVGVGDAGVVILLNGVDVQAVDGESALSSGRSTSSVVTLPNETEETTANETISAVTRTSNLLPDHVQTQRFECLRGCEETKNCRNDENYVHDLKESFDGERSQQPNIKQQLSFNSSSSRKSAYYSSLSNDSCHSHHQKQHKRGLRALKQNKSDTAITSQSTLGLNNLIPVGSTSSVPSVSPTTSRLSVSGSISSNNSDSTAKNEQSAAAAVGSTTAVAATVGSAAGPPAEKEKKRKEVSSSRVKKFHRHFSQVPKDEKLINYFSCALVSDILLQGHLYITDKHFAFYSNVFGYVTKVVIPTSSVTKISKEKTAKIIPNAVGVATADERHVFGSFISREAAFRLMCSVCPPMAPTEILVKIPADIEISEEYSIEDDSSCSISGNESPPGNSMIATSNIEADTGQTLLRRTILSSSLSNSGVNDKKANLSDRRPHSDIPLNAKATSSTTSMSHGHLGLRATAPAAPILLPAAAQLSIMTTGAAAKTATNLTMIIAAGSAASTATTASSTPSTASSSPTTVMATPTAIAGCLPSAFHNASTIPNGTTKASNKKSLAKAFASSFKAISSQNTLRLKFPTELSIVYLGVILSLILAVFSVFLLYRIVDIESRASQYQSPLNFNWRSGHDDDIFAEALRWQRELQDKSTAEAQSILTTNLEQIAKVRRSLETLSMLIRDRSSASTATVSHDDISDGKI